MARGREIQYQGCWHAKPGTVAGRREQSWIFYIPNPPLNYFLIQQSNSSIIDKMDLHIFLYKTWCVSTIGSCCRRSSRCKLPRLLPLSLAPRRVLLSPSTIALEHFAFHSSNVHCVDVDTEHSSSPVLLSTSPHLELALWQGTVGLNFNHTANWTLQL